MEFDDSIITTGVDALVRLVKQKGRVELNECAAALNLPSDTVEEWARILEEEGIIKVEYSLTKIYLVWVLPTQEKIKEVSESLEVERSALLKEIEKTKSEIPLEIKKMEELKEEFNDAYSRFSKDLKNFEEKISPFLALKTKLDAQKAEKEKQLEELESEIKRVSTSIDGILSELDTAKASIEKSKSEESLNRIKKTQDEIYRMMSELKELRKSIASESAVKEELPSAYELKKKFDSIAKDFAELKNRNSALREDLISLKEGKEIVDNVGASLKEYEKTTSALEKELVELTKDADALFERVKAIDEKLRENLDTIKRFSDSLNVANGIVSRFPDQKKLHEEQEAISKKESEIEQKLIALKKIVEMAGGTQISAQEAKDLLEQLDEKINELKDETFKLSETLEEEKNRYFTFQQIRERIIPSLRTYQNDALKLKDSLLKIKNAAEEEEKELENQMKKIELKVGKEEAAKLFEIAKEIEEKKKLLNEINAGFEELSERADNLNKRLSLLSNKAKILSIMATAPKEAKEEKEKSTEEESSPLYIKKQLQLTKEEEKEFARKREELKKLIQKLWESEKSSKK